MHLSEFSAGEAHHRRHRNVCDGSRENARQAGDDRRRPGSRRRRKYLVPQEKLTRDVHFLGKQDCVYQYLSEADLFLLPSDMESFGLAALEAMACEVPVVATNVGGLPEVVEHGVDGYLFYPA